MTLYEYKILSEDEQYDTVFSKGKFLDIHNDGNTKYVLYAIDMFFVEVAYNANDNRTTGIKSFICCEILDKYSNVPREI